MALAAHLRGDEVQAARWFERSRSACGPAALYTEEYATHQRQLRGNFPQAFVHAAILESAIRLSHRSTPGLASEPPRPPSSESAIRTEGLQNRSARATAHVYYSRPPSHPPPMRSLSPGKADIAPARPT
jgi:hypothetical protein